MGPHLAPSPIGPHARPDSVPNRTAGQTRLHLPIGPDDGGELGAGNEVEPGSVARVLLVDGNARLDVKLRVGMGVALGGHVRARGAPGWRAPHAPGGLDGRGPRGGRGNPHPLGRGGSPYAPLRHHGLVADHIREQVEAVRAPEDVREALRIARSEPVLRRTRVATQSTGPFRELTVFHYIGSEYRYCVDSAHIAHAGTTVREKAL